ncbi:MAG: hypothetical protein PUP92_13050 [Rhizonema sp. PD38]|nr:hypothetical protein [Rhizonema sp. PD38]
MKKQIVSIGTVLAFSMTATSLKPNKARANPIVAPAICFGTGGVGCVIIGTVVIGGIIYYVWQNTRTKKTYKATAAGRLFTHSGDEQQYNVGRVVTRGMVRSLRECEEEARRFEREHGGVWETLPLARTGVSGPASEGINSEPMFLCQIRRVS